MAQNSVVQIRVEDSVKKDADALFDELGLDTPTAIRMFLKQSIKLQGLPFDVCLKTPNTATILALEEANKISKDTNVRSYTDVDDMMRELLADV